MGHDRRWYHHWEEAGICLGALVVLVNLFAILTPYLSGPLFHPVWILIGIMTVFICGMLIGGADTDQTSS